MKKEVAVGEVAEVKPAEAKRGSDGSVIAKKVYNAGYPPGSSLTDANAFAQVSLKRGKLEIDDVLKMFGPIPSSFRISTLGTYLDGGRGWTSQALVPKLHPSGIAFADLFYDNEKHRVSFVVWGVSD